MGILKKLSLLTMPLFLAGCYEDFTPGIDTKPVLCVNSLITAGEPVEVSVSRTWLYTDVDASRNHQVDDAVVSIYVNGEKRGEDYIPEEGDRVRIVAESDAYGTAEAEVQVPVGIPIESLKWEATATDVREWGGLEDSYYQVSFNMRVAMSIRDSASTVDYYKFSYHEPGEGNSDSDDPDDDAPWHLRIGNFLYEREPIFSEHVGAFDAIIGNDSYGFTFFTDRQFSGDSYTLNIYFESNAYTIMEAYYSDSEELPDCNLTFSLSTVSKSYYDWCCYQWNAENGAIGDLVDIGLGDPMWGYSNVSTGAGVVAAQSCAEYTVNLKDFLKKELSTLHNN